MRSLAIQTALMGDWNQAILLNQQLLKDDPRDIETLNRLAFAFFVVGKMRNAKNTYHKVLAIDRLNAIAIRGLKRLSVSPLKGGLPIQASQMSNVFLEETGKTKVLELINVADAKVIATLRTGEKLSLVIKRLKLFVLNQQHQYVGMLPDNIGKRLIKLLRGGNSYEGFVKSVDQHRVVVFLRETKRAARFRNQPSFTTFEKHLVLGKHAPVSQKAKDVDEEDEDQSLEETDESL